MKNILLTFVSSNDPYTIRENNGEKQYNDGALLSILRRLQRDLKSKNEKVDEIYIYLSLEMAVAEVKNQVFSKAIKSIQNDVKINFFPKGVIENTKENIEKVENVCRNFNNSANSENGEIEKIVANVALEKHIENVTDENIDDFVYSVLLKMGNENKFELIARTNVFENGTFYSEINDIISNIEQNLDKSEYNIYFNITSGTPAMKSDLLLYGITRPELKVKMYQTVTPKGGANRLNTVISSEADLKILNEEEIKRQEEHKPERTEEREVKSTKKLILLKSLEDSFQKHDFAGIYDAVMINKDIIDDTRIINYVKNLYYRYIGDVEQARNSAKKLSNDELELYPFSSRIQDKDFKNDFENIIEKFNVMKIKEKRDEFNDWLLISTPIVENISTMILWANDIDISQFTKCNGGDNIKFRERVKKAKIDYETFRGGVYKNKGALEILIYKYNGNHLAEYSLVEIIEALISNSSEIIAKSRLIDTTRQYRIDAAHSTKFVLKKTFIDNREADIKKDVIEKSYEKYKNKAVLDYGNNREIPFSQMCKNIMMKHPELEKQRRREADMLISKIKINSELSRVEEVHESIKYLLKYLWNLKANKDVANKDEIFENACNIYELIQEKIITLLRNEINNG